MESLFNKVEGLKASNFIENRLQRMFSREIYEIAKNSHFKEHLQMTASGCLSSFYVAQKITTGICIPLTAELRQ